MSIELNDFVKRQTKDSEFSHFEGTWDQLVGRVIRNFEAERTTPGYRDGVVLVHVEPDDFFSAVVDLEEGDKVEGEFKRRREGEEPRLSYRIVNKGKQPAKAVDVVLYRHDVLAEDNDNTTDAEWEIISINARTTAEDQPIEPFTLMHNHFGSDGGTDTKMSDSDFAAALEVSFNYWKNKGMVAR